MPLEPRKILTWYEETVTEGGRQDDEPLRKAAAAAVVRNPYAGRPYSESLEEIIEPSAQLGALLGERLAALLGGPAESYGKAALVGVDGEQEHAVAIKTSVMGNPFRDAVGGGIAWLPSISKRVGPGATVDLPLCCKHDIWVRSHYDSITITLHDAPLGDELVLLLAVASRGRLNARVGGKTLEEALGGR